MVMHHLPKCSLEYEKAQNVEIRDEKARKRIVRDINDPEFVDQQRCMVPILSHNKRGKVTNSMYGFFIFTSSSSHRYCRVCSPCHFGKRVELEKMKKKYP